MTKLLDHLNLQWTGEVCVWEGRQACLGPWGPARGKGGVGELSK